MKKSITLMALFLLVTSFAQSQQSVLTLEKIKVKLPAPTTEKIQRAYKLNDLTVSDSTANFKVLEIDLSKAMSKNDALKLKSSDAFWAETKKQVLSQFGNVKVLNEKYLTYNDEKVWEIVFERTTKKGRTDTITLWLLLRDEFAYQLYFSSLGNKASDDLKKNFFELEFIVK